MSTIDFSNLKGLAIFASVVESGSFAAAARHLNTSRSRVSEQVANLEAALNVRLLQRTTRQLTLTDEGKQVFLHAQKCHTLLRDIDESLSTEAPKGRVSITVTNDVAHKFLVPLLPEFKHRFPDVELSIISSDDKLDLVANNIDVGIRIGLPRDDSLIGRVLYQERFSLYASPDYLAKHGNPETLEELSSHKWILLQQLHRRTIQYLILDNTPIDIKPKDYELCNSPHLIQEMVKAGLGISVLLPSTIHKEVENGELIQIFPRLRSNNIMFTLVYPSRKQVPLRTRVLIDFLIETCQFGGMQN